MTSEQKKQIHLLREKGYGYTSIAEFLGLTKNQVPSYCRRNNLSGVKADHTIIDLPNIAYCQCCGTPLIQAPKRKPIKFCSSECRVKWWNSHQDKVNKKAIYSFTCACFGKEFTAYGNAKRKYCSHPCYITARFGSGSNND